MLLSPKYFIYNIFPVLIFLAIVCYVIWGGDFPYIYHPATFFVLSVATGIIVSAFLWIKMRKRYHRLMVFCYMLYGVIIIYSPITLMAMDKLPVGNKTPVRLSVVNRYYTLTGRRQKRIYHIVVRNDENDEMMFTVSYGFYVECTVGATFVMTKNSGALGFPYLSND